MASQRMIKDWTESEKVNLLSAHAEVFFTRLIMKADDYGSFHGNPKLLKANLFPLRLDAVRDADISRWIAECEKAGLILVYTASDKKYVRIINFGQRLRAMKSKYPTPDSNVRTNDEHMLLEEEEKKNSKKEEEVEAPQAVKFSFKESLISYGFEKGLVDDWLLVRKNKRATNSETAFNDFIKELEKRPCEKNEILRHVVSKSWSGFNWKWMDDEKGTGKTKNNIGPIGGQPEEFGTFK